MKVSLIVTTYNWKEALSVVLQSVVQQSVMPLEVIIADDGSREDTKALIEEYQQNFPVPLIHSWQEDKGFRAAKSRNKAVAKASGDYIVLIDGDMLLHKDFIKAHINSAKKGYFVQGGRVLISNDMTQMIFSTYETPNFFSKGIRNRKNAISNVTLSKLFSRIWNSDKSTRSCNLALWKDDYYKVNGFNEEFEGWGREDSEFVIRLLNAGFNRLYLKFYATAFHLYHKEHERESLARNQQLLEQTIDNRLMRCQLGADQY